MVGEAKRVRDVALFCVRVGDRSFGRVCKCIYVFKIRGGWRGKRDERERVGREGNERGSEGAAW